MERGLMMNNGFGYQSWNAKRQPTPPTAVGEQLAAQSMGDPMAMMDGRGGRGRPAEEGMAAVDSPMAVDGQSAYDPTSEHSATNTRAALEDAIRRAADLEGRPALKRAAAPNQQWQLATLGLDPLSIQLFTQTGDAAGGL